MRRWFDDGLRSYLGGGIERGRPRGSLPFSLRPVVLFFTFLGFFVCVLSVVEVAVLLLFRLLFFVVFLAAFPLLSCWSSCSWLSRWVPFPPGEGCGVVLALRVSFVPGVCLRGAPLWFFLPISTRFRILGRFLRHYPCCGVPARWRDLRNVVFRHLPQVVSTWRVAWKRSKWCCWCMWSHRGGDVSTLRVVLPRDSNSTREKGTSYTTVHRARSTTVGTRVAQAHDTRVHEAYLALNPRRYVNE